MHRSDSDNSAGQNHNSGAAHEALEHVAEPRYMWEGVNEVNTPMNPQAATMSAPFADAFAQSLTPKVAVSYLRVSTRDQAYRDGEVEGFSIPAQREANRRKAASLGALVVKEFVDRGASAKTVNRPELQRMLEYVAEHPIDYVIVHKVDRLARSREDDVEINRALGKAGVRLVSTTESIDETPSGILLHGIMSSIAEFYSRNLANEVVKGMSQKARKGGTVSKAPLGYRNTRTVDDEGREVRTVILDPERAPLITEAFKLYATGNWTLATLAEHLSDRGLTTLATPRVPSKSVDKQRLNKILINPYYKGMVKFQGVYHPGKHEPLIDEATWQLVQNTLQAHLKGEKTRKYPHFLKGSVYCSICGARLGVSMTKSKTGELYPYFVCLGRQRNRSSCNFKAVLIEDVEERVQQRYEHMSLDPQLRHTVERLLLEELHAARESAESELDDLRREREKLERQRDKLMQAHYEGAIPVELLKREQERISTGLADLQSKLDAADLRFDDLESNLRSALDLAENCGEAYRTAPDSVKRIYNQFFFERILVKPDGEVEPKPAGFFEVLFGREVQSAAQNMLAPMENTKRPALSNGPLAKMLPNLRSGRQSASILAEGSVMRLLVEPRGIEPLTFWLPARRSPS